MIDRRWLVALILFVARAAPGADLKFERIVVDADFPAGYQVEVADVNGDGKPDLIGVGGGTCAWYENPSWKKRLVSTPKETPDIISSATADLDGDGKAEIAIAFDFAMNEPKRGKLTLAIQGANIGDPWTFRPVADVPSIHRVRWGDLDGVGGHDLVVASLFGPEARPPAYDQDPARLVSFAVPPSWKTDPWVPSLLTRRPVLHAIEVNSPPPPQPDEIARRLANPTAPYILRTGQILLASNEGIGVVNLIPERIPPRSDRNLFPGSPGPAPKRGSSEIHGGRLADGRRLVASIDPWHGNEVAVIVRRVGQGFAPRLVIDDTLDDGHALWVADVDGDGTDEVFAGHRGKDARVSVYRLEGEKWARTVIDRAITAQDLRGGDLDGDGVPDVVAIGGKSHNILWYRPIRDRGNPAAK